MVSKKHQPTQDTTGNAIGKVIGMRFPGQHSSYHDTRQGAAGFSIALPGGKLSLTRFLLANLSITFFSQWKHISLPTIVFWMHSF